MSILGHYRDNCFSELSKCAQLYERCIIRDFFFKRKSLSNTLFIEHILQKEILGILILIYRKYSELWTAVTKNHLGNALIIQRQYETLFKARQMVFK